MYRTVKNFSGKNIWRIESLQSIGEKNLSNKDTRFPKANNYYNRRTCAVICTFAGYCVRANR